MKKLIKILTFTSAIMFIALIIFYFNYQFWTHLKTDNFESLIEYKGENIYGFRGRQILIHKEFKKYIVQIDSFAKINNIELVVNQSYRSDKQTLSRTIVEPGKLSNHHAGFAIDFNIIFNDKEYFSHDLKRNNLNKLPNNIQDFINDIRENKDLRWGGDFKKEDPVHIDNPINLKNNNKWIEYTKDCALDYSIRIPLWKIW